MYDINPERDNEQSVLAAYANLAHHNLFVLFNDIAQRAGLGASESSEDEESGLEQHKLLNKLSPQGRKNNAREQQKIIHGLERSFRFITPLQRRLLAHQRMADSSNTQKQAAQNLTLLPENYQRVLKLWAQTIAQLRNHYTHACTPAPIWFDDGHNRLLEDIFDAAIRVIKARHGYEEKDVAHLRRAIPNPKFNRNQKSSSDNPRTINNPRFKYAFTDANGTPTRNGILFFLCLLLPKRDGYALLKKISGFKNDSQTHHKITLKVFTCFHLRLPYTRIDSQLDAQTLGLDILNELTRCPRDLFEHLSPEQQKTFEEESKQEDELSFESDEPDENDGQNTLLIRHQDRFIPLMMRYFDETCAFNHLRFQIDLGDFYFTSYPKTLYANNPDAQTTEVRRLKLKVFSFNRLTEIEQAQKPAAWLNLERTSNEIDNDYPDPYIVETTPHYHLLDDNIGLKWVQNPAQPQLYPEPQKGTPADENAPVRYDIPQTYKQQNTADFWLSRHEMLHMGFYQHLYQKYGAANGAPSAEQMIVQYRTAINALLNSIDAQGSPLTAACVSKNTTQNNEYKFKALDALLKQSQKSSPYLSAIQAQDLPDVVALHLIGEHRPSDLKKQAERTIDALLEDNTRRLKRLSQQVATDQGQHKDRRNKAGAAKQRPIKAGDLADFLARDILRLQPIDKNSREAHRGKATSLMFGELQARLAYYGRDKHLLPELCSSMGLINNENNPHPFLDKLLATQDDGIIAFYRRYLEQRAIYLSAVKQAVVKDPTTIERYIWLKCKKAPQGITKINTHIQALLKQPLNLPRGLFAAATEYLLRSIDNPALTQALNDSPRINTSYMLALYAQHVCEDSHLAVYDAPRQYKVLNQAFDPEAQSRKKSAQVKYLHTTDKNKYQAQLEQWLAHAKSANYNQEVKAEIRQLRAQKRQQSNITIPTENEIREALRKKNHAARKHAIIQFDKNEKMLRQQRSQDHVLFWAAQDLLVLQINTATDQPLLTDFRLKTLTGDALSSTRIPYAIKLHDRTIARADLPIKKIGDFRHYLKDRRLKGLFNYLPQGDIPYDTIRLELEDYQRQRLRVFDALLAFEKRIIAEHTLQPNAQGYIDHQTILAAYTTDETQRDCMNVLRNAFAHNQYPDINNRHVQKYPNAHPLLAQAQQTLTQQNPPKVAQYFANLLLNYLNPIDAQA